MQKNIQTSWDLKLFYKDAEDPAIERDIVAYEKACTAFEKKYKKDTSYIKNESKLVAALTDYEKMYNIVGPVRVLVYFNHRKDINSQDQEAESKLNHYRQRITHAGNKIIFFDLELAKIPQSSQKKLLKSKKLVHYKRLLEKIFETAKYNLSESEEKILNLKSITSRSMWVQGQQKLLNQQVVEFNNEKIPLTEATNKLTELPTDERRKLSDDIGTVLKSISYFAESELNALYTDKKISDELRKFKHPYSATIFHYDNKEKSIENLIATVTKHFSISHEFYDVKSKMLGLKEFEYADRAARAGKVSVQFTFEECIKILKSSYEHLDEKFIEILDGYLENGQIDVYPKKGKRGGAYCSGAPGIPTCILLNHVDTFDSLKTFAHEMGHAIHTELSKSQPVLYQDYPISIAEVASTLFENFAFDVVFPKLSDQEKIVALHDRINDAISTVFRQIAAFNFELELHQVVRAQGAISKEDMAALHNKHMRAYLGPKFKMKETDGYFFVQWPHIRSHFYVYSYAYGELISKALYNKFKQEPSYIKQIEKFLSAGSSASPEQIFKSIGVDTSKPEFFEAGLMQIHDDILKLKSLISSKK